MTKASMIRVMDGTLPCFYCVTPTELMNKNIFTNIRLHFIQCNLQITLLGRAYSFAREGYLHNFDYFACQGAPMFTV